MFQMNSSCRGYIEIENAAFEVSEWQRGKAEIKFVRNIAMRGRLFHFLVAVRMQCAQAPPVLR